MELTQIGFVHAPHTQAAGTPVQAFFAAGVEGAMDVHLHTAEILQVCDLAGGRGWGSVPTPAF